MSGLNLDPNLAKADDFYESLLTAHQGLSKAESDAFNARLILVLANHVGDEGVLSQALEAARLSRDETSS